MINSFIKCLISGSLLLAVGGCGGHRPAGGQDQPGTAPASSGFPPQQALLPGASGTPAGGLPNPDRVGGADPQTVAAAAVKTMWTVDTAIDHSQRDADLRAAPYLSPVLLALLMDNAVVAAPGAQWDTWSSHQAYTTVTVRQEHDDPPPDDATTARRQEHIDVLVHSRDGSKTNTVSATVFVTLTRSADGPWRVADLHLAS